MKAENQRARAELVEADGERNNIPVVEAPWLKVRVRMTRHEDILGQLLKALFIEKRIYSFTFSGMSVFRLDVRHTLGNIRFKRAERDKTKSLQDQKVLRHHSRNLALCDHKIYLVHKKMQQVISFGGDSESKYFLLYDVGNQAQRMPLPLAETRCLPVAFFAWAEISVLPETSEAGLACRTVQDECDLGCVLQSLCSTRSFRAYAY